MRPTDIELATIRAWPAAETEERFGWFLLASGGVTGRVNAAWPIGWTGEASSDDAIDAVEAWYAARKLPPRFKLTDGAVAPADLPGALARRGYAPTMHTLVMTMPLQRRAATERRSNVSVTGEMPPAFDEALVASTSSAAELDERRSIARRVPQPCAFGVFQDGGRTLGIGASALAGDLAGIFLMRTIPEARRRGCANAILHALLAWAKDQGASNAFLQVEADNAPAIALYERAGFTTLTSYRFWKR